MPRRKGLHPESVRILREALADAPDHTAYRMTDAQVIRLLARALTVAAERALDQGDRLLAAGHPDINRGQFKALVCDALKAAADALDEPEFARAAERLSRR